MKICDTIPDMDEHVETERAAQLRRRIGRLGERLERLRAADRRFSWLRLGVFAGGLLAVGLTALVAGEAAMRWAAAAGALVFIGVVFFHRRLDRALVDFTIWHALRREGLARLMLDWEALPAADTSLRSERCALDIDLDLTGPRSLHRLLNLAVSHEGSRRLAEWLCNGVPDAAEIARRQGLVRELAALPRFRDRLLLNLRRISAEPLHGERMQAWLDVPADPAALGRKFVVALLLALLNAALFILGTLEIIPQIWPLSFGVYFVFYLGTRLTDLLEAMTHMDTELDRFRSLLLHLEHYPLPANSRLAQRLEIFRRPDTRPSAHLRRIKAITTGIGMRMNPIMGLLLNAVFPWDLLFATLAARQQVRLQTLLPAWLEGWYELEALSSLAGFAWLNPAYAWPRIAAPEVVGTATNSVPALEAEALGHPLILAQRRVCNDFTIPSLAQVFLVTGSNMAGKSTFIKTVGVALCLAYAGGPVCARRLQALPMRLYSCIRITDSIADGFSYFYAEVRCLRGLLDALQADDPLQGSDSLPVLYLIDEIFRGTNNRERLLGSRAYIKALAGAAGCGFIATHDLELATLADDNPHIHNYHFTDRVEDGRLAFDYRIHPGPSPTTNALKIMAMEGLPVEPA